MGKSKKSRELSDEEIRLALEEYLKKLQKASNLFKKDLNPNIVYPFEGMSFEDQVKGEALLDLIQNSPERDTCISDLEFKPFLGVMGLKAKRKNNF